MSFDTSRSNISSSRSIETKDDRFYTPRSLNSRQSSRSDDWHSGRHSDGEYLTPRDNLIQDTSYLHDRQRLDSVRESPQLRWNSNRTIEHSSRDQEYLSSYEQYSNSEYASTIDSYSAFNSVESNDIDIEVMFSFARHDRREEIERRLDQGIPVDIRDEYQNTMLIIACQNNNKRMAKLLLRRGANINAKNYRGNTPLHYCYHYGYGDSLGEYLISKGADATIRNNNGKLCWDGI